MNQRAIRFISLNDEKYCFGLSSRSTINICQAWVRDLDFTGGLRSCHTCNGFFSSYLKPSKPMIVLLGEEPF